MDVVVIRYTINTALVKQKLKEGRWKHRQIAVCAGVQTTKAVGNVINGRGVSYPILRAISYLIDLPISEFCTVHGEENKWRVKEALKTRRIQAKDIARVAGCAESSIYSVFSGHRKNKWVASVISKSTGIPLNEMEWMWKS